MDSKSAESGIHRLWVVVAWLALALVAFVPLAWHTAVNAADAQLTPHVPERQISTTRPVTTLPRAVTAVAPDWLVLGRQDSENFGISVDVAGDYNGDEFDDLLIGANWFDDTFPNQGRTELYLGNPAAAGPFLHLAITVGEEGADYGRAVAAAGDVDGDGFGDFLSSAPGSNDRMGVVFVDFGDSSNGTYQSLLPPLVPPDSLFGFSLAAGDVNGDGYDDVLIGAPGYPLQFGGGGTMGGKAPEQTSAAGAAFLYYGGPTGVSQTPGWSLYSDLAGTELGYAVAIGDFDGDGFGDIAVGAPQYSLEYQAEGGVFVFYGSGQGPFGSPTAQPFDANWFFGGEGDFHQFGDALAATGSVNGDPIDDLLIGAPGYSDFSSNERWGAVYGFIGNVEGLSFYNWFSSSYQVDSQYGTAVAILSDINDDGIDDILVGAPGGTPDTWPEGSSSIVDAPGAAYLFLGDESTLFYFPQLILSSGQVGSRFGESVGGGGDVNGDGYGDFFIGAPGYAAGNISPGAVFGYYGSGPISRLVASNSSPTPLGSPTFFSAFVEVGTLVDFEWNFGDGNFGLGAVVSHTYALPGVYTAVVTAFNPTSSLTATTPVTINVSSIIDPTNGGSLSFISPLGWGINVNVPPGAVEERVGLAFTPLDPTQIEQPLPPNPSTYFFDLDPVSLPQNTLFLPIITNASASQGQSSDLGAMLIRHTPWRIAGGLDTFPFLVPITLTITYIDAQIPGLNEDDLILTYWDGNTWVDAVTTCPEPEPYIRDPQNNFFSLKVCHLSRFGMSGR